MPFSPPEEFNIADYFLDDRIREGHRERIAIRTDERTYTYGDVQSLANRFGDLLRRHGAACENRILIALPDGPEFAGALFGILKIGAVGVMLNPHLKADEIPAFLRYTRARFAIVHRDTAQPFLDARSGARYLREILLVGDPAYDAEISASSDRLENEPTHRDDAAIWLFSGGTTGRPKGVVQTHTSFANTTECYAKQVIRYGPTDITLSVPKLYFGYATGSNLFFPFAAGASTVLFPERPTPEVLFEKIRRHRPTILVTVPTMIHQMTSHPEAGTQDLSSLRLSTSAGEALPPELYRRWKETFGVEVLDGLGTAEMWHIFISNRPADVRPATIGRAVPGFDVTVRDEEGRELPAGEVGTLWVRGDSRAIGYWQNMKQTREQFRGDWYVTGDLVARDEEGYFRYHGRGDEMLKVSGKWFSPQELENVLLQHPSVKECAVVGVADASGLIKPRAYVIATGSAAGLEEELKTFARERLDPHKYPREVVLVDDLPRTHLGKVDRGALRRV